MNIIKLSKNNLDKYFEEFKKSYNKIFKDNINKDKLLKEIENSYNLLIYLEESKVIGYINYSKVDPFIHPSIEYYTGKKLDIEKTITINELFSLKKGLGTKIMNTLLEKHKDYNFYLVPSTDKLISFYEKFGFKYYKINGPSIVASRFMLKTAN